MAPRVSASPRLRVDKYPALIEYIVESTARMQHFPDPAAVHDGKLRGSCDRCHKLKNRCLKTGAADGRCDRCARLDFDCVYRSASRMGRPKGRKTTSSLQPPARTTSIPTSNVTSAAASRAIEILGSITVNSGEMEMDDEKSPSASPPQENYESPNEPQQSHQSKDSKSGSTSSNPNATIPTLEAERSWSYQLFQLQDQLHRTMSTARDESVSDTVQAGLDVTTRLLGWLQDSVTTGRRDPALAPDPTIIAETGQLVTGCSVQLVASSVADLTENEAKGHTPVSFITVQQVLACYSYVLVILEQVVNIVTSDAWTRAAELATAAGQTKPRGDSRMTLRLGGFSLASQPSLNAEAVLHLALRMVQSLSRLIQDLASRCEDLAAAAVSAGSAGWHKEFAAKADTPPPIPVGTIMHAVSSLVIVKERALIARLAFLSGGY